MALVPAIEDLHDLDWKAVRDAVRSIDRSRMRATVEGFEVCSTRRAALACCSTAIAPTPTTRRSRLA